MSRHSSECKGYSGEYFRQHSSFYVFYTSVHYTEYLAWRFKIACENEGAPGVMVFICRHRHTLEGLRKASWRRPGLSWGQMGGKQQGARRRAGMFQTKGEAAAKTRTTGNRTYLKNIKKFGIFRAFGGGEHWPVMRYARPDHEGPSKSCLKFGLSLNIDFT